jgi:hypothetical protein
VGKPTVGPPASRKGPTYSAGDPSFLSRHPRFKQISGYEQRLVELCSLELDTHHKQELISCMSHKPGSYVFIERQLMHATSFEVYKYDEIDKLDDAADKLFKEVNEF